MENAQIFSICNMLAMVGWLLNIIFPGNALSRKVVLYGIILLLSVLYCYLIAAGSAAFANGGGFSTLAQVKTLFTYDTALLAGWVHYLAFDLFTGLYINTDSAKHGLSRWFIVPCLLLTFMFGPAGLLLYLIGRAVKTR
jgi:hypothetical protein